MNIFFLSSDPVDCAKQHVDKHVVKMILEYAQLLSTAHRVIDGVSIIDRGGATGRQRTTYILPDNRDAVLYRATHINHPSAVWVRQRESHYRWLFGLWIALMDEYTYRYGRVHASSRLIGYLNEPPNNIEYVGGFDNPPPAMPDAYKVNNTINSYRNYYMGDKKSFASWKNRETPSWFL